MRSVLVTLADRGYLDAARQLFAGAHFAGGWKGDYLLLTHEVPEQDVRDFPERGLHVKPVPRHPDLPSGPSPRAAQAAKLFLFHAFFRRWDRVVFQDGDILVRARLGDELCRPRFGAVRDLLNLRSQNLYGHGPSGLPNAPAFNSGVLSFDTGIISDEMHDRLAALWKLYGAAAPFAEQPVLNYYFHDRWTPLPLDYNLYANLVLFGRHWPDARHGTLVHFIMAPKPWEDGSPARSEWQANLERFPGIDINRRHEGRAWTHAEARRNRRRQRLRFCLARLDAHVGETAAALRRMRRRGRKP